jgi:hypothetical protein
MRYLHITGFTLEKWGRMGNVASTGTLTALEKRVDD